MKVERCYDQDTRYDWASIDLDGATTALIVIHTDHRSEGFTYCRGEMEPTCICHARKRNCTCP